MTMAEQQVITYSNKPLTAKERDDYYAAAQGTFDAFIKMAKWSSIAIAVVLVGLYVFLVA